MGPPIFRLVALASSLALSHGTRRSPVAAGGERLLMYSSHAGLGNQLIALESAWAFADILNRTLVVAPILEHGASAYGSRCRSSEKERQLAVSALAHYNKHGASGQSLYDLLTFSRRVVRFDPRLHSRPTIATNEMSLACTGTADWWTPLAKRREHLIMVGSTFKHRVALDAKSALERSYTWKPQLPWAALVSRLGQYVCAYVRWPDSGHRDAAKVVFSPRASTGNVTTAPPDAVYVASEHEASALCKAAAPLHKKGGRCFTLAHMPGGLRGFSVATTRAVADVYACSRATEGGYCASYHTSTFWKAIRMLSDQKNAFPAACQGI